MTTAQRVMICDVAEGRMKGVPDGGTPLRCWRSLEGLYVVALDGAPKLLNRGQQVYERILSAAAATATTGNGLAGAQRGGRGR